VLAWNEKGDDIQLIEFGEVNPDDFTGIVLHSDMEQTGTFECSDPLVNQLQHHIFWGLQASGILTDP
jgi:hypothetical protein